MVWFLPFALTGASPAAPVTPVSPSPDAGVFDECRQAGTEIRCGDVIVGVTRRLNDPSGPEHLRELVDATLRGVSGELGEPARSSVVVDARFPSTSLVESVAFDDGVHILVYAGPEAGRADLTVMFCGGFGDESAKTCEDLVQATSLGLLPEGLLVTPDAPTGPTMGDYRFDASPTCDYKLEANSQRYQCPGAFAKWHVRPDVELGWQEQQAIEFDYLRRIYGEHPGTTIDAEALRPCRFGTATPTTCLQLDLTGPPGKMRLVSLLVGAESPEYSLSCSYFGDGPDPCSDLQMLDGQPRYTAAAAPER